MAIKIYLLRISVKLLRSYLLAIKIYLLRTSVKLLRSYLLAYRYRQVCFVDIATLKPIAESDDQARNNDRSSEINESRTTP